MPLQYLFAFFFISFSLSYVFIIHYSAENVNDFFVNTK
nr:MAG TPA: hypothetical protein [Caudoviricetes sp.]